MTGLSDKRFIQNVRIRLDDVDFAQVLYYPRVVHMCCVALEDFFTDELGLPWRPMFDEHRLAMPTVDLHVTYRRPLRFGDHADISITVQEVGNRKATYRFEIRNTATAEITAEVTHTVVFVDADTWQAVPIPEPYRSALESRLAR